MLLFRRYKGYITKISTAKNRKHEKALSVENKFPSFFQSNPYAF